MKPNQTKPNQKTTTLIVTAVAVAAVATRTFVNDLCTASLHHNDMT